MPAKPKKYRCTVCAHTYDPAEGDPESEVPPGRTFEELSEEWHCPGCGASKADFEPLED